MLPNVHAHLAISGALLPTVVLEFVAMEFRLKANNVTMESAMEVEHAHRNVSGISQEASLLVLLWPELLSLLLLLLPSIFAPKKEPLLEPHMPMDIQPPTIILENLQIILIMLNTPKKLYDHPYICILY